MDQIIKQIKEANHLLLVSHSRSGWRCCQVLLLALGLAIGKLDKKATLYNASPIPAVYRFLPSVERIVRHIKKATTYDVALILDCGNLSRIGEPARTVSRKNTGDHQHRSPYFKYRLRRYSTHRSLGLFHS